MKFKRTASNCKACPFGSKKKVWGLSGIENPQVVIIGEAPGEQEEEKGEPFVGASGARLKDAVAQAGIIWHTTHRMNVICCRPPNNNIESDEAKDAIECCKKGFEQELKEVVKKGAKVLIPTGNTALKALGIEGAISKTRGSVYPTPYGVPAVPTYHPAYILRGAWKEEPTWIADLGKAKELSLKKWKPVVEKFNIEPAFKDVKEFVDKAVAKKSLVAVDIETTSLNEFHGKIVMIGLALNGEEALVVPLLKQGGGAYWGLGEETQVRKELNRLFDVCPTMFQNASFDVRHLEAHGFKIREIREDTMLAHHAIHPELPHNLEYIVSVYGKTPAWKASVKGSMARLQEMDPKVSRTYNARDTVVLHQVIGELHKDLEEMGTMHTYRHWSMRLLRPLIEMSKAGMLIDPKRLQKAKNKFKRDADKAYKELQELCHFPEGFNIESSYHLQALVYGQKPKNLDEWKKELYSYEDAGNKKRKDTKKYQELHQKVAIYEWIKPLVMPKGLEVRRTLSGSALDDEAFLSIQRKCILRIEALDDRVRQTAELREEKKGLEKTLAFMTAYRKYAESYKLASTYSGYPVGPDGRVHPSYKIHGTATGRLSASEPNLQNQPAAVQDVFVAGPGRLIIKADYSNIELRVLAYLTGEPAMIEAFESGVNIHDVNTMALFGIDKSHPDWKDIRRAAKIYVFGRSYGGGVEGIYKQVLTEVPSLPITFTHFRECDRKYFERMSKYRDWCEGMKKQARETRVVSTAFGRKRILLGTPDEIERQALNTPIQGTAGEIAEEAICSLYEEIEKPSRKSWKARLVLTVHDSILVEVEEGHAKECAQLMKKVMEKKYTLNGKTVSFPVDIEVGPSWGETEVVEMK